MNHFFKKELLSNPLRDSNGVIVQFEPCAGNCGVISVADDDESKKQLLADLNKVVGSKGLVRINSTQYDELKKKVPLKRFNARSSGPRIFDPNAVSPYDQAVKAGQVVNLATGAPDLASAAPVEAKPPAEPATAQADAKPFVPRRGRAKK